MINLNINKLSFCRAFPEKKAAARKETDLRQHFGNFGGI
jgi:hypothetical protein